MTNDENDGLKSFVEAYRANLEELQRSSDKYAKDIESQYVNANQNLDNARRNQFQNIMSSANARGMLYSNFPERAKIQYDTNTYKPAQNAIQDTYQTGLQKLRDNTVNLTNQISSINEAIEDFNKITAENNAKKIAEAEKKKEEEEAKKKLEEEQELAYIEDNKAAKQKANPENSEMGDSNETWVPTTNSANDYLFYGPYEFPRYAGETDAEWEARKKRIVAEIDNGNQAIVDAKERMQQQK